VSSATADPALQRRYLQAMGIDLWVPRRPAAAADPASGPASREAGPTPAPEPAPAPGRDWEALRQQVAGCTRCALHSGRTQTVFGVGNREADWMVIGEAPGAEEDRRGEPFVGRAGQLLNAMLRGVGLAREAVYIANILKCRPPNNRDPQPEEVACCEPYLREQVALVQPGLILAVGRVAAQNLLKTDAPLGRLRGRLHRYGPRKVPVVVTYHPAYLLRNPVDKRKAWDDLCLARQTLAARGGAPG